MIEINKESFLPITIICILGVLLIRTVLDSMNKEKASTKIFEIKSIRFVIYAAFIYLFFALLEYEFKEDYKLVLSVLSIFFAVIGMMALQHRSRQTAHQITISTNQIDLAQQQFKTSAEQFSETLKQNKINNYFLILEKFEEYSKKQVNLRYIEITDRNAFKLFIPNHTIDTPSIYCRDDISKSIAIDFYNELNDEFIYATEYILEDFENLKDSDSFGGKFNATLNKHLTSYINTIERKLNNRGLTFTHKQNTESFISFITTLIFDFSRFVSYHDSFTNPSNNTAIIHELAKMSSSTFDRNLKYLYQEVLDSTFINHTINIVPLKGNGVEIRFSYEKLV